MPKFSLLFRFIASGVALSAGALIVLISLFTAQPVSSTDNSESTREFYVGQTILPDHVLYPFLMVADRVKLSSVNGEQRIYTQVVYGLRRLEASHALLEKDKEALAYTTLTKSQKYLLQAGREAIGSKHSQELALYVEKALIVHNQMLEKLSSEFSPNYYAQVNQLIQENEMLIKQLEEYRSNLLHPEGDPSLTENYNF